MTCLPDVNVWVALAVAKHVHHEAAKQWFEESLSDTVAFCRVTQMGLLRLLTNARVMAGEALTAADAWDVVDAFCWDDRILFTAEPPGLEDFWRAATRDRECRRSFWTDAYLAAFASSAGHTLVSFDKGFSRFKTVSLRVLRA